MISSKIIADSISHDGVRITTFELEYPRFIHSELMTHRVFSRNAASSRAIPVDKTLDLVRYNPAQPVYWGKNQSGMQAKEELQGVDLERAKNVWLEICYNAIGGAEKFNKLGLHKQIANRVLETFQHIKVVITATEFNNFFYLRDHKDAQPEIHVLSKTMLVEMNKSTPIILLPGQWHVPYYQNGQWLNNKDDSLEDALAISASCCAQVSYRKLDQSLEKAKDIYKRLVDMKPVHASPFEHQATPIHSFDLNKTDSNNCLKDWEQGITHMDRNGQLWSGNFKGWIQNRQLIPGNTFK